MLKEEVVQGVMTQARWWLDQRLQKVRAERHGTMEVNPFMAPLISALHGHIDFDELAEFLIGGHFAIGHATGFGKLIDEKILPVVFKTTKLSTAYRSQNKQLMRTCFDNVDHIVKKNGETVLLSQKASKWTIQLGQAVELNKSFQELISLRESGTYDFDRIIVATFYGKTEDLSDKYRILRGITTGAAHSVVNISAHVDILAGKNFWSWIGENDDTQYWVMEGINLAIKSKSADLIEVVRHIRAFKTSFSQKYHAAMVDGIVDWKLFLTVING